MAPTLAGTPADGGQKTSASGPSEPDQPAAAVPGLEKG